MARGAIVAARRTLASPGERADSALKQGAAAGIRAYFLHDRRRLGLLSRVASRTLHAYVGAALGEAEAVPGVISLAQSFGSLAHGHPHLHLVVTDGGFRRDGCFVGIPAHDAVALTEAWRRAVLARFVRQGWLEEDVAATMLAWPHSGFSAHVGPWNRAGRPRECAAGGALRGQSAGGGVTAAL